MHTRSLGLQDCDRVRQFFVRNYTVLLLILMMISISASSGSVVGKAALRNLIKDRLKLLTNEDIIRQSEEICTQCFTLEQFINCNAISVYLAMPKEVQTLNLIKKLLQFDKKIYIPTIIGKNAQDMVMLPVNSYEDILLFPKNKWGIPEPALGDIPESAKDPESFVDIDLVIMPGVAFDSTCGRIGHGKGYYGEKKVK